MNKFHKKSKINTMVSCKCYRWQKSGVQTQSLTQIIYKFDFDLFSLTGAQYGCFNPTTPEGNPPCIYEMISPERFCRFSWNLVTFLKIYSGNKNSEVIFWRDVDFSDMCQKTNFWFFNDIRHILDIYHIYNFWMLWK